MNNNNEKRYQNFITINIALPHLQLLHLKRDLGTLMNFRTYIKYIINHYNWNVHIITYFMFESSKYIMYCVNNNIRTKKIA